MGLVTKSKNLWQAITARLNAAGTFFPQLFLRFILFWEFWEAGKMKLDGGSESNWFASIQDKFPFPFDSIDPSISWAMATWGEVVFSLLILCGLFTRFAAFSLIILTIVATAAVHWPAEWNNLSTLWQGYAVTNKGFGNFKLPLLYIVMLLPLLFSGAGKFSLDHLLTKFTASEQQKTSDLGMWGLVLLVVGTPLLFLMPYFGGALTAIGLVTVLAHKVLITRSSTK